MAVSRKTQKDVGKFEAKFVGPFTMHQTIFVAIAVVLAIIVKLIMDAIEAPTELTVVLMVAVAIPPAFLGFKKFNGMTAIEYFKLYKDTRIDNPSVRLYKRETDIDVAMKAEERKKAAEKAKKPYVHKSSEEFPDFR